MITIQTIIDGNCKIIKNLFDSIASKNVKFLVTNIGADSETIKICNSYDVEIDYQTQTTDYSEALNLSLPKITTNHCLYLNPWEQYLSGDFESLNERIYNVSVISNNIIVKEPRIWLKSSGIKFKNPICQTLTEKTDNLSNFVILSIPQDNTDKLKKITNWCIKDPTNVDATYYNAAYQLILGNHENFLNMSEKYMRLNKKKSIASTMNKYYFSMVKAFQKQDSKAAIQNLIQCIEYYPLMAEFWCLLGDIYYENLHQYEMAAEFYENGYILGSQRKTNDQWPIDIDKYDTYPKKMIESCKALVLTKKQILVR